jgi:hypothetical protein
VGGGVSAHEPKHNRGQARGPQPKHIQAATAQKNTPHIKHQTNNTHIKQRHIHIHNKNTNNNTGTARHKATNNTRQHHNKYPKTHTTETANKTNKNNTQEHNKEIK